MLSILQAAGWPIIPLVACSILMLALIIERFVSLRTRNVAPTRLLEEAMAIPRNQLPAVDVLNKLEKNSLLGEILAAGFKTMIFNTRLSDEDLRASMEAAGRSAAHKLERYLAALGTIASAAPLLGLLGTVIGMIEIFGAQAPTGGAAGNPAQLAHGISVALYNTAFGLIVAIPALIFWRYFRARVDKHLLTLELSADRFARHLSAMRTLPVSDFPQAKPDARTWADTNAGRTT